MKKIFTLLFIGTFFIGFAQLPVSQNPEKKKIVLEEHTGKTCTFCPDGHKIANGLKEADPNNVFLINIHAGSYAAGTPNYRTDFGSAIASQTQLSGYPSGSINRFYFGYSQQQSPTGATALGKGQWAQAAATAKTQDAIVNVACEASIDVSTNILSVTVQAYYTGTSTEGTNYLNVALTQDNIWGPQTGASNFWPEQIDPVTGLYQHNHMLRHMLTGQWGEAITTVSTGDLVTKTYTYTLPTFIGDVDIDISQLYIVAFMTETQQKILNAGGATPSLVNLPNNLEAEMMSLTAPEYSCDGIVSTQFNVRNFGQQNITALDIVYAVNNGTSYTYSWTGGPILPGHNLNITMPLIGFQVLASNELEVTIDKVNGSTDDVPGNNTAIKTILAVEEHTTNALVVEVTPDAFGSEIGWELLDANGDVVDEVLAGTYADNDLTVKSKTVSLPSFDCYTFRVSDTYGDGLLNGGKVELKDNVSNLVKLIPGASYSAVAEYKFASVDASGNGNGNGDGTSVNPTGIRDINSAFTFGLFPNPANEVLNVSFDVKISKIEIINVLGAVVLTTDLKQINVTGLTSGMYFVALTDEEGRTVSKSFVKR